MEGMDMVSTTDVVDNTVDTFVEVVIDTLILRSSMVVTEGCTSKTTPKSTDVGHVVRQS